MEEKLCARCKRTLPVECFREKFPGKYDSYCHECRTEYNKEYDRKRRLRVFWKPKLVAQVLFARENGMNMKQISKLVGISHSAVFSFFLQFDGETNKLKKNLEK